MRWSRARERPQDVDFAHAGTEVQPALPATLEIKAKSAIEALADGFLPAMRGGAWDDEPLPTATFVARKDRTLRIDFLTPPAPMRYALHKLVVHVKRGEREKAPKDLRQAAALLEVLGPGAELKALWRDLVARGDAWNVAAGNGRDKLKQLAPKLPALKSLT